MIQRYIGHKSWLTVCLILLGTSLGCHGPEDDDHHLEHLIPAHKPAEYARAVQELRRRAGAMFQGAASATEHQELVDIVNWLPELAADSDLSRAQWERVQAVSRELERRLSLLPQADNDGSFLQQWQELVGELETFIPDADRYRSLQNFGEANTLGDASESSPVKPEPVLDETLSHESSLKVLP